MTTYTPEQAAGILERLASLLERTQPKLARDYAEDVRTLAMTKAAGRPSPQAAAVGRELELRESRGRGGVVHTGAARVVAFGSDTAILSGRPVRMADVSFGAEFGADRFPQFGPRRAEGHFLHPAARDVRDEAGKSWLDGVFDRAFRSFGRG